jgi:hypothetical protein
MTQDAFGPLTRRSGGTRLLRRREPIPRPQRLRLLGAAKRVECIGGGAGAVSGPSVVPSKHLLVTSESAMGKDKRPGWKTHAKQQAREIETLETGRWMLWAERFFADGQRVLVEWPRPC